ncbi:hypothetical protein MKW98_020221 [Papaver atlanticum]|uniref:FBD domain-containing protein n=1 Tax=Papaver atlanticum TaxID=357466 RepID=A0AAD4XBX1_9MAGN|nr:hypothetical protein MKW98_020221 [Papaver atlanticum]
MFVSGAAPFAISSVPTSNFPPTRRAPIILSSSTKPKLESWPHGISSLLRIIHSDFNNHRETEAIELSAEEKEVFAKRMMKFLGAVHNARSLTLSSGFLEVLSQAPGTLYHQPPQLCKFQILKLELRFTRGCLRSIAYLLKISPMLRILKLKSMESNLADVLDDWEAGLPLTCMFSHLKFVEIREVEGCDNEIKFLRFLLKKSTVLEKVNLFFQSTGKSLDKGRQVRRFKRNLRVLPSASSRVKLKFF